MVRGDDDVGVDGGVLRQSEDVVVLVVADAVVTDDGVDDRASGELAGLGDELDELAAGLLALTIHVHHTVDVAEVVRGSEESVSVVEGESERVGRRRGGRDVSLA